MDEEGESNCFDSETQDLRMCSREASEIFSHVIATIAFEILECIHGDKETFLKGQMSQNLNYLHNEETGAHCVFGSLDDIVEYRNKLESLIDGEKGEISFDEAADKNIETPLCSANADSDKSNSMNFNIGVNEVKGLTIRKEENAIKVYRDIGVNCDLFNEDIVKASKKRHTYMAYVENEMSGKMDGKMKETDTNADCDILQKAASEILPTQNKIVTKSKRGRPIKRPLKLQQDGIDDAYTEDSQQASVHLFLQDEEIDEPKPVERKKRRLIRSKKRGNVIRPKDRGKISVEEVRRLVQEEKEKEVKDREMAGEESTSVEKTVDLDILNPGVLQTMFLNSWNEGQESESQQDGDKSQFDIKDMEQRKQMKKYYEDRMPFKYFCDKCSFKTKRESHYQAHMNLHERKPNMALFTCEHCDFVSIRQSVLNRHQLTHSENLISCPLDCSYKTQSRKSLKNHTRRTHMKSLYIDPESLHSCDLCPFQTTSRMKLITHKAMHGQHLPGTSKSGKNEFTFRCDQCNYKTTKRVHLVRHKDNVHSNNRPFLCDLCGAAFKRVDALAAHKTTHLDRSKRKLPYVCNHCKKAFKSWAHLKEHSSVHTTVRSFQCHICGQMFKTRSVQRRHQQSIHFNPRSHKCSHCNKEFNTKYAFKRHLRIHDNDPMGQTPTQVQPQVATEIKSTEPEEAIDENVSAIQTITIAPENINEFTQQLQNVSDQLQSSTDIGEIYIQGLDGVEAGTINIVSMSGQEIRQILIPSDTDPNTLLASSDQVKQIFVTSKSNDAQTQEDKDLLKQMYVTSGSESMEVSEFKELYVQQSSDSNSVQPIMLTVNADSEAGFQTSEAITVDLVEASAQALEGIQSLDGNQTLIVQDAGIQRVEEGDKSGAKNQTFELKLEGGQTLLTLGSTAVQNL